MSDTNELPNGWATAELADVTKIVRGISFPTTAKRMEPLDGDVACLRTANVQREVDWDDLWYVDRRFVRREEQFILPLDILISTANSFELVGKVSLVRHVPKVASLGAFISLIRSEPGIESKFIYHQLESSKVVSQMREMASTTTNISNISTGKLQHLLLRLAPLNEQYRIVAKIEELFSDLDAGVAALNRAKANLKRYRAAVLKAAVEGQLTEEWRAKHPTKEPASALLGRILRERRQKWEADQLAKFGAANKEPPKNWKEKYVEPMPPVTTGQPELPKGWCWASVEQLTGLVTKGSSPGWQGFDYVESGVLFLRSQNVRWGSVDLSDVVFLPESFNPTHQNSIIHAGDVLLNLVGASIGRSALAPPELDGANTNQAVGIIRLIQNGLRGKLLVIMLLSPQLQSYIAKTKADVARANFNLDDVRPTPIPLPGELEQSQIIIEVEERLSQIDDAETQIEHGLLRASRLRQSILKRAFEGRLVPQDPQDEPASVLLERLRPGSSAHEGNGKAAGPARGHRAKPSHLAKKNA